MTTIGQDRLSWKFKKLYYKDKLLAELIPHDSYPNMWHVKFYWREDKTPEYFNLVNAKENSRIYALYHLNLNMQASPREARG